ncbi:hypothetical protein C6N75_27975 [Streptomyces solincola]|uniref:SGNH hydrolase-type esterase domain-containing protein n=1 Tax=Streptomyces solincola TaxID=2100817 RepID=A0A2S9PNL5_9ACTN|nr:SGNH/GDSL hydrolase family protein [Streptomyces solincola]PRH76002.1 hypothetical protein C6N75_27975 [Streptomyces solincola]
MTARLPGPRTSSTAAPADPYAGPRTDGRRGRTGRVLALTAAGVVTAAALAVTLLAPGTAPADASAASRGPAAGAADARPGDAAPNDGLQAAGHLGSGEAVRPQARPLRIMPLGDSITFGVGSSTGSGYRGPLWDLLQADARTTGAGAPAAIDFVGSRQAGAFADRDNEGHSGALIRQIAQDAAASVPLRRPDVILLHAGTNDMNRGEPLAAPGRLEELVEQLHADAPDATLVVATLVPARPAALRARIDVYNTEVRRIVAERAAAGYRVLPADMAAVTPADLTDKLHPADRGYAKMADAWHTALATAAAKGWLPGAVAGG